MKYFDLNNSGTINKREFIQGIEKIGIQIFNQDDFTKIFKHYKNQGTEELDYKTFSQDVIGTTARLHQDSPGKSTQPRENTKSESNRGQTSHSRRHPTEEVKSSNRRPESNYSEQSQKSYSRRGLSNAYKNIDNLKNRIQSRGVVSLMGLGRYFTVNFSRVDFLGL